MVSVTPLQRVSLTAGLTAVRPVQGPTPVGPATKAEEILAADPVLEAVQNAATQRATTLLGLAAPSPQLQKAVAAAAQAAVVRQTGLAPLMADLAEAAGQPTLPPALRQAAAQVLAQRTPLTPAVQAADVQDALARSGLLMEARIADGGSPPTPANDLKAALLALRQTLRAVVENAPPPSEALLPTSPRTSQQAPAPTLTSPVRSDGRASVPPSPGLDGPTTAAQAEAEAPAEPSAVAIRLLARTEAALARPVATAPLIADLAQAARAPNLPPQLRDAAAQGLATLVPEDTAAAPDIPDPSPGASSANSDPTSAPGTTAKPALPGAPPLGNLSAPVAARSTAAPMLSLETQAALAQADLEAGGQVERAAPPDLKTVLMALRQTLQAFVSGASDPAQPPPSAPAKPGARTPPPPFRGGPTQGQAAVEADLPASTSAAARRLLSETDGALARQQLMQVASLPAQRDPAGPATRWMFEVPFTTPQGSAVGQFEIARDPPPAGGADAEPTWRARFSLDLSPLGPLHAHVSLLGANVGVALWAEQPVGLAALRHHQASLTKALLAARLAPEVAVYPGQPASAQAAPGRFVDQAL